MSARDPVLEAARETWKAAENFEWTLRCYPGDQIKVASDRARLLAAIAAAREALGDGWLPIKTAPRDGTRILVFFPADPKYPKIAIVMWEGNIYEKERNWTLDGGESAVLTFDPPTHWQPLPAPPAPAGHGGTEG